MMRHVPDSHTKSTSIGSSHDLRSSFSSESCVSERTPILNHSRGTLDKKRSYHPPPRPFLVPNVSNFLPGMKSATDSPFHNSDIPLAVSSGETSGSFERMM